MIQLMSDILVSLAQGTTTQRPEASLEKPAERNTRGRGGQTQNMMLNGTVCFLLGYEYRSRIALES